MYITESDKLNKKKNWHLESIGTATKTKNNNSQRIVLSLILNTSKLISAASKSWHSSQSGICFCVFNWFEKNGKTSSRVSGWKWEFINHEPSAKNDAAILAANTKLSSSWPHSKPESLHFQESLSWRKLALNGYLSSQLLRLSGKKNKSFRSHIKR